MTDVVRVLVAPGGLMPTIDDKKEEQHAIPVARMDHGFFTDGQEQNMRGETKGATPFMVVKVKPSVMIWIMLVQCKCVEDQAAIKDTVEPLNRLGDPELTSRSDHEPAIRVFRDAVGQSVLMSELLHRLHKNRILRLLARWKKATRQVKEKVCVASEIVFKLLYPESDAPFHDERAFALCSFFFGASERARRFLTLPPAALNLTLRTTFLKMKKKEEKVRTLLNCARELHGLLMNPEHVPLS